MIRDLRDGHKVKMGGHPTKFILKETAHKADNNGRNVIPTNLPASSVPYILSEMCRKGKKTEVLYNIAQIPGALTSAENRGTNSRLKNPALWDFACTRHS